MANALLENNGSEPLEPSRRAAEVPMPLLWLLGIVLVGLLLRGMYLREPLQLDEFPALYAVMQRASDGPDLTPKAATPLLPVASWQEIRERSVLPYGITNPVPIYHYLLYLVVQVLPVAEWSLRLPSLLAGLGCIAGVYFLCRRLLGTEVALVAALLTAVDPIQVTVSVLARPYALGNLACVLSFLALLAVLHARTTNAAALGTVGYALATVCIGYLNPVLLMVLVAHVGLVGYAWFQPALKQTARSAPVLWWLGGCAAVVLLMLPLAGYVSEMGAFARQNRDYLLLFGELRLLSVLAHNSTFLAALLVVSVAAYVARQIQQGEAEESATAATVAAGIQSSGAAVAEASTATSMAVVPALQTAMAQTEEPPPPENPELVWLARIWLFWPQMVLLVLAYGLGQALFLSRYLSYTTLGGAILLAYWATRERSRDLRLGVSGAVALTVFLWGLLPVSRGLGLVTPVPARLTIGHLDDLEQKGKWQPGDVLLVRSGFLEADFLPDRLPEATRQHVRGALLSPYTTLYVGQKSRPIILLSKSHARSQQATAGGGALYDPGQLYNEELAKRLRSANQLWIASNDEPDRKDFLLCFLPWLADALDSDLLVARNRPLPDRYFDVYTGSKPLDYLEGLSNAGKSDFTHLVRVQRHRPPWAYRLGGVTDLATGASPASLAVQAWRLSQERTPRLTESPDAELNAWLNGAPGAQP